MYEMREIRKHAGFLGCPFQIYVISKDGGLTLWNLAPASQRGARRGDPGVAKGRFSKGRFSAATFRKYY